MEFGKEKCPELHHRRGLEISQLKLIKLHRIVAKKTTYITSFFLKKNFVSLGPRKFQILKKLGFLE